MINLSFLLSVFVAMFVICLVNNSWLCIFPMLMCFILLVVGEYAESKMNDRIKRLEEEVDNLELKKEILIDRETRK